MAFRSAARYEPALEGLVRAFVSKGFIDERERAGKGIADLVRSAMNRLGEGDVARKRWQYTRTHSAEVARFGFVIAREAQEHGLAEAKGLDAALVFAGGLIHDVGKTFIPTAILVKELGIDFYLFTAFGNAQLNAAEKRIMREEHVSIGTRYVRLFGAGAHIRMMLDMVGLHHVMYNGMDSGVPSYPSLLRGVDLPFHASIAKAADFISAVMPRHYRTNGFISSIDGALAYAVTAAGTELNPAAVSCFITGHYDIGYERAKALVARLAHPMGQAGVSDIHDARLYSKDVVREDPEFKGLIAAKAARKMLAYDSEMLECARGYGLDLSSLRVN